MTALQFQWVAGDFGLAQLPSDAPVPVELWTSPGFVSVSRSADELSICCAEAWLPAAAQVDRGWALLKLVGPFAFDQIGILRAFIAPLAEAGIGIFAISTYDTDYVLVKQTHLPAALEALRAAGHRLANTPE